MATLADAVEEASVPLKPVLDTEVAPPVCPLTITVMVVPSGIFEASRFTVMGFVVPTGKMTSGFENEEAGDAGAVTPATEAILKVGEFASITELG